MSVVYRPGFYCDVCVLADGRFVHVVAEADVVAYVDGGVLWRTKAGRGLLELRCAFALGRVYAIGKEKDSAANVSDGGTVYLVTRDDAKPLGLAFGAQSVAIDATYAYVVRDSRTYDRIALATGEVEHLPHGVPGSSQGIRDIRAGVVIWADNTQAATFARGDWSIALHQFSVIDPLVVGQTDPPQIAGVNARAGERFTAIDGEAYEPHIAQSGDKYAICARTPKGAAFVVVPPFPAFVSGAPAPIPVPQPKPEDPKPVPVQNRASQLAAFHQQYNSGLPITDDAEKHRFTAAFASSLNKQDGDTRWGRKARAGTDAVSKDTLGYWLGPLVPHNPTDGKVDAFDIIASTGAVSWDTRAEQNDPGYRSIDARWFPVAAVPDSGTTLPNPGTPAPTVPADYERRLKAVEDAVSAIEAANSAERVAVAQLGEALKMLGEKPAPTYRVSGTTSRDFGHSHRINVTLEPIA